MISTFKHSTSIRCLIFEASVVPDCQLAHVTAISDLRTSTQAFKHHKHNTRRGDGIAAPGCVLVAIRVFIPQ